MNGGDVRLGLKADDISSFPPPLHVPRYCTVGEMYIESDHMDEVSPGILVPPPLAGLKSCAAIPSMRIYLKFSRTSIVSPYFFI